jgi:protein-S-isoprenylcysteine O-methyltransferase Ste14
MVEELFFRILIVLMWVVFAVPRIFYRRKAARSPEDEEEPQKEHREGFGWVQILISIGIIGMFISLLVYGFMPLWLVWFPLPLPSIVRWMGVILGFSCVPFLVWIHRQLGRSYSPELAIKKDQVLVTSGPYSRIRHPMYTVFILFTLGILLVSSNLFVTIFGLLIILMLYPNAKQEERMLLNKFGDRYQDYMNRTGLFFPRITKPRKFDEGSQLEA